MDKTANRNTFWAHTLVDELQRSGLEFVVIAPGSRSTPLALAFGSQPGLSIYVHPDERGAAFFALGIALASAKPVAVLCTSGTAAANFYPAVVEAHQSQVPLLILTADRPAELRDSGANQTIDQVKLFGGYVRWAVETPVPEAKPDKILIQALRSLANRAMAAAAGPPAGPVHLNLPFRKPLEPVSMPGDVSHRLYSTASLASPAQEFSQALPVDCTQPHEAPLARFSPGRMTATPTQIQALAGAVRAAQRGIIYCGPRCPGGAFPETVYRLSLITGFPIFADALSGLRFHPSLKAQTANHQSPQVIAGYETFLKSSALLELAQPDLVLQFGALPISKSLGDLLTSLKNARRFQIQSSRAWADDAFNTTDFILAEPEQTIQDLLIDLQGCTQPPGGVPIIDQEWLGALHRAERLTWQAVTETRQAGFFEGAVICDVLESLDSGDSLFVASSLPVRHLDQFGQPQPKLLHLYANRGASGIDGTIASACGVAASASFTGHLVLVTGDLAFLHDLNSLLLLYRYNLKVSIVLINNDGGGIFRRLPIADSAIHNDFEALFNQLFTVPHGLSFEHAAYLFHLGYTQITPGQPVSPGQDVSSASRSALENDGPQIIEVITDAAVHEESRRHILQRFDQLWKQT